PRTRYQYELPGPGVLTSLVVAAAIPPGVRQISGPLPTGSPPITLPRGTSCTVPGPAAAAVSQTSVVLFVKLRFVTSVGVVIATPPHDPPVHASLPVHALPSLHAVPSGLKPSTGHVPELPVQLS